MAIPVAFAEELREMIRGAVTEVINEQAEPAEEEEEDEDEEMEEQAVHPPPEEELELPLVDEPPVEAPVEDVQMVADTIMDAVQAVVDQVVPDAELPPEEEMESLGTVMPVLELESRLGQLENDLALERAERDLETRLTESRLPGPLVGLIRDQFGGRHGYRMGEVDQMITRVREAAAALDPTGRVRGAGATNGRTRGAITMGLTGPEQAEVDFLHLVSGDWQFRQLESIEDEYVQERLQTPAFRSWVKAGRPKTNTRRVSNWMYELLGGNPLTDQRAFEAVSTSSMTSIIKNTLNLLLAANYAQRHQWWGPIVRQEEVDTIDDATLVRVYGLNTLAVVEEGMPYDELEWADEEETASFVKKGNFVGVTLETLLRDKLNMIRTIPERLSTSWYNTISTLVSNVFTLNSAAGPVLADTGALFNASALSGAGGHANLLTTAFSYTAYDAVYTAMQKQTDQPLGAGQRLLAVPKFVLGPADMRAAALQVRNSELIPGSANNDVNVHHQGFEWVPVPTWTDVNNWAAIADPNLFPVIWLIFLRGRAVPELFTADSETAGAMFTNDTIRYKVRMLTFRFSGSYDCAPVADFRGVHKSNVAG